MLCLGRRCTEAVVIGTPPNQVTIIVKRINHDRVQLAIDAPHDVSIRRSEISPRESEDKST